jgi:ATP-binding cassette subfamily B protein|tara:strand:+ start:1088 stop:2836 length:1749 start_codon:yes stop_codon:yes gene_type:complete
MKELRKLDKYLYKYRFKLLAGLLITIISRIFSLVTPRFVGDSLTLIENYISNNSMVAGDLREILFINISIIIGASIISGFFTFLMRQTIINVSRYIEFDIKSEIFSHYQTLDQDFYKKNRTGDLMNRISEDVSRTRMYFGPVLMYGTNAIVLFIIIISYMFTIEPKLTLYTLIPLPFLSIIIYKISNVINIKSTKVQESLSDLSSHSQQSFSGISILKSFNIQKLVYHQFDKLSIISFKNNLSLAKIQAWFFPLIIFLIGLSNLIVIYIGGNLYINGAIEIGVVAEFLIYVNMLTWPVTLVGWVTATVKQAEASQKRINEFLNEKSNVKDGVKDLNLNKAFDIKFKNVDFIYKKTGIKVFDSFNLKIEKGEKLGVIGNVGSGKTTLLDLISRVYDPNKGEVTFNGNNIKDYKVDHIRGEISYVPQNNFLFSDSIEKNIGFGNVNANIDKIVDAAKRAEIHNEIEKFKNNYKTILGERGVTLSGGQVQRVSISRAFLKNASIYLFDDCFSSLDSDTEEKIISNMHRSFNDKTLVIVSHRLSCLKYSDRIIVLEDGKIIQEGNHSKLIEIEGYYKDLYYKQMKE